MNMPDNRNDVLLAAGDISRLVAEDKREQDGTWAVGTMDADIAYGFERAAAALVDLAGTLEGALQPTPEVSKVVGDLDKFADELIRARYSVEVALARRGRSTEEKLADGESSVLRLSRWIDSRGIPYRNGNVSI